MSRRGVPADVRRAWQRFTHTPTSVTAGVLAGRITSAPGSLPSDFLLAIARHAHATEELLWAVCLTDSWKVRWEVVRMTSCPRNLLAFLAAESGKAQATSGRVVAHARARLASAA